MDQAGARRLLEAERERLTAVRDAVERDRVGDEADTDSFGELSPIDQHQADVASEVFEREKDLSIKHEVEAELAELDAAFARLDAGTYGRCEIGGEPIPDERLEALPATRYCIEHEQQRELEGVDTERAGAIAEDLAVREANRNLDFVPDEDLNPPGQDVAAEVAAMHRTRPR